MDTKTILLYGFAALFAIIEIALTEESKVDLSLGDEHSMQKRLDPTQDALDSYDFTDDDLYELMKRGSLLRFGKRGSLLRFGKRGSILRFGKRGSLFRFGKRFGNDDTVDWPTRSDEFTDDALKRSSLFRFGKKAALFRYGRSAEHGPHTPFRFGREEVDILA